MPDNIQDQHEIRLRLPHELYARVMTAMPKYTSFHNHCLQLLDQSLTICYENGGLLLSDPIGPQKSLTQVPRLSVRAANSSEGTEQSLAQAPQSGQAEQSLCDFGSELVGDTLSLEKTETTKTKTTKTKKVVPSSLQSESDLIYEFFKGKKGSKADTAWNFLIGQLEILQNKYGGTVVKDQLLLAINSKWNSITVKNFEQYNESVKPIHRPSSKGMISGGGIDMSKV